MDQEFALRRGAPKAGRVTLGRSARLACASALLLLFFSGLGCRTQAANTAEPETRIASPQDPGVIEVARPELISLVEAQARMLAEEIRANGVVAADVSRSVPVLSLSGGRVVEIKAKLGDDVRKGQVLLRIHSADLAAAFSDLQKAKADEALARKQLERSRDLFEHGAIAQKDLEAAENAQAKAVVDLKTAEDHVLLLGGDPDRVDAILEIRAPVSGTIIEQNVTAGTGVRSLDATPNLFTIADLSRIWVLCDVFEDAIAKVRLGDAAEVHLVAYPDLKLVGSVSNIGRILDPATRSAKVRIELENRGLVMCPGMFVTATFRSSKSTERALLPASALVREHDQDWVFRALGGNRFKKVQVQPGPTVGEGLQQILAGVQVHDKVVENALQFSELAEVR